MKQQIPYKTEYYASIQVPPDVVRETENIEARNKWWRMMFPKTADLKNKRRPQIETLLMLLERKIKEAHQRLLAEL